MAEATNTDAGLGLSEFLKSAPAPTEGEKPSQEAAAAPEETKSEAKPAEPVKEETKQVEEAKVEAKTEVKEEKKEEPKPQADWDADDNPYKKRYWQTQQYSTTVQQQNAELKKQLEVINKKLDGTYDPAEEAANQVPVDQMTAAAEVRGKAVASRDNVIEWAKANGKDETWVDKQIEAFDRTLGQDPLNQVRVLKSNSPIMEAFKIMQEHSHRQKWGKDFGEMEKNIRADEAKKFETKLDELVNKRLEERLKNIGKQPTGIREARESSVEKNGAWQPKSLDEILAG